MDDQTKNISGGVRVEANTESFVKKVDAAVETLRTASALPH